MYIYIYVYHDLHIPGTADAGGKAARHKAPEELAQPFLVGERTKRNGDRWG